MGGGENPESGDLDGYYTACSALKPELGGGENPEKGDLDGYLPTPGDRRTKEVYVDWVRSNDGSHITGEIRDDIQW